MSVLSIPISDFPGGPLRSKKRGALPDDENTPRTRKLAEIGTRFFVDGDRYRGEADRGETNGASGVVVVVLPHRYSVLGPLMVADTFRRFEFRGFEFCSVRISR